MLRARTTLWGITLVLFATLTGARWCHAQTCTVTASAGTIDSTYNTMVTQNGPGTGGLEAAGSPGWTGADSTYSILLPNGNSTWFYSDSYIGQSPTVTNDGTVTTTSGLRKRTTDSFYAHNGYVIRNSSTGELTTVYGAPGGAGFSTSLFTPTTSGHIFWMYDSVVVQTDSSGTQELWVMLAEFTNASGTTYAGSSIAEISLPSMNIVNIFPLSTQGTGVMWGTSLWLNGSYGSYALYIYGIGTGNSGTTKGQPYVAWSPAGSGASGFANMNSWFYATYPSNTYSSSGPSWTSTMSSASPIIGETGDPNNAGNTIANGYSMKKIASSAGTTYLLVAEDMTGAVDYNQKHIVLYSACHPYGPFSAEDVVYTTPETLASTVPGMTGSQKLSGKLYTYNPHAHPEAYTNGDLLISYNVNATDGPDHIYADAYHARFIDVFIAGYAGLP